MVFKVLLILPSYHFEEDSAAADVVSPPVGLLYMAAVLQERGYPVQVLDMDAEQIKTRKKFSEYLKRERPDLIGISTLTKNFKEIINLVSICKEELSEVPISLGAHFATFNYDKIMPKYNQVDFIVRGEGEEAILELVMELEKRNSSFNKIDGLVYREKNRIRINRERPMMKNLDALPFPAYELTAHLEYKRLGIAQVAKGNINSIVTSRGCNHKCTYCACSAFSRGMIRWRNPEKVLEEIRYFHDRFGTREYLVVDDNFTSNKKHVLEICNLIKENRLDIDWYAEGRVNQADSEMFNKMKKSGAKVVYFGIESCVDRILNYYRKGITYQMAKDAVRKAQEAGMDVIGSFIFGAPIETVDEMWETVRKSMTMDLDFVQFNSLGISRGTPLWAQLVQQGLIDENSRWEEVVMGFELNSELELEDIPVFMEKFNKTFYLRKSYLLKQILRTLVRRRKELLLNIKSFGGLANNIRESILQRYDITRM